MRRSATWSGVRAAEWVALALAVLAGATGAVGDGGGVLSPGAVAALALMSKALRLGLSYAGRPSSSRSLVSWLLALALGAMVTIAPALAPTPSPRDPSPAVEDAPDPGAPGVQDAPSEATEPEAPSAGEPEAPPVILGMVGGVLGLACSGPQRAAMRDVGKEVGLCLANCGVREADVLIRKAADGQEISGPGVAWDVLPCLLPCLARLGTATLQVYAGGSVPYGGSADRASAPDRLVIRLQ